MPEVNPQLRCVAFLIPTVDIYNPMELDAQMNLKVITKAGNRISPREAVLMQQVGLDRIEVEDDAEVVVRPYRIVRRV